jgi:Cytosol aminopeptidase family, N-terminal domain
MAVRNSAVLIVALISFSAVAWAQPALPIDVRAQSPAETTTELQVICLFQSSPENTLHGSLLELNEKLNGLIERVRKPELFRGELGETLVIAPPPGNSLGAKRLLIIGLGESQSFSPQRMQFVGEILYMETSRVGVAHPFFAPTVLDGGVGKFTTGEVAEQVIGGFLRAAAIDKVLGDANASSGRGVTGLTYLAGLQNVSGTSAGIEKAIAAARKQ